MLPGWTKPAWAPLARARPAPVRVVGPRYNCPWAELAQARRYLHDLAQMQQVQNLMSVMVAPLRTQRSSRKRSPAGHRRQGNQSVAALSMSLGSEAWHMENRGGGKKHKKGKHKKRKHKSSRRKQKVAWEASNEPAR